MPLAVGTLAPDFTLKSMTSDGPTDFRLADQFGRVNVVLLLSPRAFTRVCKAERCKMSGDAERYDKLDPLDVGVDTFYAQNA